MATHESVPQASTVSTDDVTIQVGVIEDILDIRESLRILINGATGFRCVWACHSVEAAREKLQRKDVVMPALILTDIGLPGLSGTDGIREFKQQYPQLLFVMLTVYDDDERIFQALCAGACGYLLKKTPPARLLEAIREACEGGAPMSPEIARRVLTLFQQFNPPAPVHYELTPHETRLLQLLSAGHSIPAVAREFNVTRHAIAFHLRNIYDKLHVHSKSEAVAKALRHRLIT